MTYHCFDSDHSFSTKIETLGDIMGILDFNGFLLINPKI